MDTRQLGANGPVVSEIGLGCMAMSGVYGPSDENESIATIHEAIDSGVNLLGTGDFYGMGHNEMLLSRAIAGRRDKVLLSVKFGAMRAPSGAFIGVDARPAMDPAVTIEETVAAIADLVKEGYVRYIGLLEMSAETARRANAVYPIVDLQIEYALVSRGIETDILPSLRAMKIGVTAYGLLSRGLLSGSKVAAANDFRAHFPRFTEENRKQNTRCASGGKADQSSRQLLRRNCSSARLSSFDRTDRDGCEPATIVEAWRGISGDRFFPPEMAELDGSGQRRAGESRRTRHPAENPC